MRLGKVWVFGLEVKVLRDATLRSARPVELGPMEYLDSRVVFINQTGGYIGASCGPDAWPPKGFGQARAIDGLRVKRGDYIAIHLYVRGVRLGRWDARGTVIEYVQAGRTRRQTEEATGWDFMVTQEDDICRYDPTDRDFLPPP